MRPPPTPVETVMPSRLDVPVPAPFHASPTVSPMASLWISTRSAANSSARRLRSGKPRQAGMLSGETSPEGPTMGPAAATPIPSRSAGWTSAPRSAAAAQASRASYSDSGSVPVGDGTRPRPKIRPVSSTTAAASLVPPTSSASTTAIGSPYRPSPGGAMALLDLEQLLANRVHHRLHPRVQVQLLEDVADVVLDGVLGDVELFGDVAVVVALGAQLEDLHLALGEPRGGDLLLLVGALDHGRELIEELGGHGGRDQRLALGDRADRVGDLLDRDLLEQVAVGAGLDGVVQVGFLVGDGQHQDLGVRDEVLDGLGRLDAA